MEAKKNAVLVYVGSMAYGYIWHMHLEMVHLNTVWTCVALDLLGH